ncbi:MAG: molybdopterin molybdotransferase MoeA [Deltaproteobacteria bacterium]|jgi:molybdopterin molybdotransferase|nr:molybdopterin molybdotransferase MoeA [Deltaproteobacteria bacterium]MBT4527316.1 molybdopterin molybdotransferase MoeA [Deltaproteobacteria bacterium]
MISYEEALNFVLDSADQLDPINVPIEEALLYVLAKDVTSDRPLPPFNRVAMDGFAVNSSDFTAPEVRLKLVACIAAGDDYQKPLQSGEAIQIMTGAPCVEGADAVVMVEKSKKDGDFVVLTEESMAPGLNIAKKGEDAPLGKILIPAGTRLNTTGIAICASVGLTSIPVYRKPVVNVISTGSEIIPPNQEPLPHQIRDCNSFSTRSLSKNLGIEANFLGIGEDNKETQSQLIKSGLKGDILILSGGVSMGEYDLIPSLLAECGVKNIFHNIKVKPGKPVWFGKSESGTYVFGMPGNPVSVQAGFKLLIEPLILKLMGLKSPKPFFINFELGHDIHIKNPRENYIPAQLKTKDGKTVLQQVFIKGSGDFSNVISSHGLMRFPAGTGVVKAGSYIQFISWNRMND